MVGKAKVAYEQLRDSIIEVARARAAAEKIIENEKELLTLEEQAPALKEQRDKDKKAHDKAIKEWEEAKTQEQYMPNASGSSAEASANYVVDVATYTRRVASTGQIYNASEAAYQENLRKQKQLKEANQFLKEKCNVSAEALMEPENPQITLPGGGGSGGGSTTTADKFAAEKDWREQAEASARISYATGETDFVAHTKRMNEIAVEFYEKQLMHNDLSESERLTIIAEWREAQVKLAQLDAAKALDIEENSYNERMAELKQFFIDGQISKETYDQKVEELEIEHQRNIVNAYKEANKKREKNENEGYESRKAALEAQHAQVLIDETTYNARLEELERIHVANLNAIRKEQLTAERQLLNLLFQQTQNRQQKTQQLESQYANMKKEYFGDNPQEAQAKYDADFKLLKVVYQREIAAAGDNAAEKLRIEEAFEQAKLALKKKYGLLAEEDTRNAMEKSIASSVEWLNSDGGKALTGTLDTVVSGMSAVFSQLSSLMQAELEIQTAAINKRYDAELQTVQGNSYKVAALEKKKEEEIANIKNEANRKMFAMQVIQAVAQTATNALNAYGSAAAVPVVGYILAPIAAAMAVATGAIQIASIKKQQQASEAQGYAEGGFTGNGGKYEPAGIVHRGEWVASQKLLASPVARPMIEALDYVQRTNTIGSLKSEDVSRAITANNSIVHIAESDNGMLVMAAVAARMSSAVDDLTDRLREPFVTVNTVTGNYGIKRAQENYSKLINNVTPKSRRL